MATVARDTAPDARIRAVATALFFERGYHATTMRSIAEGVGMKAGSLYNHYPGKQDLFYRIVADTTEALLDEARQAVAETTEPEARLRTLIESHVRFHVVHRLAARVAEDLVALEPPNRAHVVALRDGYEQLFRDVLVEGRMRAGWRVPDEGVIAIGIATMCTQVATWFRDDGPLSVDEVAAIYGDLVVSGLAGGPARGQTPPRA
jgi:AcrR family transcriptional regulator